jgi:hypothetical protein
MAISAPSPAIRSGGMSLNARIGIAAAAASSTPRPVRNAARAFPA